ncbi:MAG TPA: TatD family hydrolase [Luteimonas sp.]|jgi:TatD DNase family protein|nr:TatD family hydrolase [Luteimonas sp.]
MELVDSHCHLDAGEFDGDRDAVVRRARTAGVTRQIVPAVDAAGWPKLRDVCRADAGLFPAYGLHPICLASHRPQHLDELRQWIERERPLAIGECGLDFYLDDLDADTQQFYFKGQLQIARDFDLPLVVHARRAVEAVIIAVKSIGGLRGVVHSFAGSPEQARQLAKLDFMIGLGGPVTYPRANRLRKLAAAVPIEQLLLETDAPDQPDSTHRGQRNEPACIVNVLDAIARLRGEDPAAIAAATTRNAERLFGLPVG